MSDTSNSIFPTASLSQPQPQQKGDRKYKILVVDDEDDARTIFHDMLSDEPEFEVSTAADGVEALAKAEATKFDIILLDIIMPQKDGIETLTDLMNDKDKYGEPKVIMLTNLGGELAVEEAMKIGAVGYKVKVDTEPAELVHVIKAELGIED